MSLKIDLIGQRFGKLVVVEPSKSRKFRNSSTTVARWKCECDCGNKSVVDGRHLRSGKTKSCGCYAKVCHIGNSYSLKHGHARNTTIFPEYHIWTSIKQRCLNPRCRAYPNYGGRGLKIAVRWQGVNGYINFIRDVGRRPARTYTLERIDNNRGYFPSNCKWATRSEQIKNRRPVRAIGNFSTRELLQELKKRGDLSE